MPEQMDLQDQRTERCDKIHQTINFTYNDSSVLSPATLILRIPVKSVISLSFLPGLVSTPRFSGSSPHLSVRLSPSFDVSSCRSAHEPNSQGNAHDLGFACRVVRMDVSFVIFYIYIPYCVLKAKLYRSE